MKKNKLIIKLTFPEITEKCYQFSKKFLPNFITSYTLLAYVTLWRGQITSSQGKNTISKKDIQSIPSMKYTAKLYSSIKPINQLLAATSVLNTAYFDNKEYESLQEDQKEAFIINRIEEASKNGRGKILANRQISNNEDLITMRRGIVAKIRGTLQATALYNPETIIRGYNISHLTWELFVDTINSFFISLGYTDEEIIDQLKHEVKYDVDSSESDNYIIDSYKLICLKYILDDIEDELIFEDAIIVSNDDKNIVPMESILKVTRNKPTILFEIEEKKTDDLFISSALEQQKVIKRENMDLFNIKPREYKEKGPIGSKEPKNPKSRRKK